MLFKLCFHLQNNKLSDRIHMYKYIHKLEGLPIYNSIDDKDKIRKDLFS